MAANRPYLLVPGVLVLLVLGGYLYTHRASAPKPQGTDIRAVHTATTDASRDASTPRRTRASDDAIARVDQRIASHERRASERSDDWLSLEFVALGYMERARLSGDYRDYRKAEEALERAFRIAPAGAGPVLTRANLNYALHRLRRVEEDLRLIERWAYLMPDQRSALNSLRADVAFHSGRYEEARSGYERALAQDRSVSALVSMAQLQWKTGRFDEANTLLVEAAQTARGFTPDTRAWVCLVRGLMELDRGRWDDAIAHYREGLRHTPSSWLLQEHVAEILTLQGHYEEARLMYLDIIERTGNPEFMDAVAEIYETRHDTANARAWVERARTVYDQRLALYPEAAGGHALDHFLRHDPARAVQLAELNRDARPGGEAQVKLAQAYFRAGRLDDARATIDRVLATAWNTADLHAVAASIYTASGDSRRASEERAHALALNPHAAGMIEEDLAPACQ